MSRSRRRLRRCGTSSGGRTAPCCWTPTSSGPSRSPAARPGRRNTVFHFPHHDGANRCGPVKSSRKSRSGMSSPEGLAMRTVRPARVSSWPVLRQGPGWSAAGGSPSRCRRTDGTIRRPAGLAEAEKFTAEVKLVAEGGAGHGPRTWRFLPDIPRGPSGTCGPAGTGTVPDPTSDTGRPAGRRAITGTQLPSGGG